jgi:hypothetical protein
VPLGELKRLPPDEASFRKAMRNYTTKAKREGRAWELSPEEVRELFSSPCSYCGAPPRNRSSVDRITAVPCIYTGIDRLDSSRGYTRDNVTPCCAVCNLGKRDMPLADWLAYLNQLVSFRAEGRGMEVASNG